MSCIALLQPSRRMLPGFMSKCPAGVRTIGILETELAASDPSAIDVLLVPMHIDQQLFAENRDWIERFLGRGGTLVFNGPLAYPFLPSLRPFEPVTSKGLAGLQVRITGRHPVFEGVSEHDLTFRRGVAGFFGRGTNPPPEGAEILATVDGLALTWVMSFPGEGRLFMHGGNDIWTFGEDDTTAGRLLPQLYDWSLRQPAIAGRHQIP